MNKGDNMDNIYGPNTHKYYVSDLQKLEKIKNHPNYLMVEENIHVIKNFLTEEECLWFQKIAESYEQNDWEISMQGNERDWWRDRIITLTKEQSTSNVISEIMARLKFLIDDEPHLVVNHGIDAIHRLRPGETMYLHCDNPIYEDYDIENKDYRNLHVGLQWSITIYLNNFEGGRIAYPNLNISYKPKQGDILFHPGNKKYSHHVNPVTGKKIRYITTTWLDDIIMKSQNNKILGWDELH